MKPNLAALLVALGVSVGGIALYGVKDDVPNWEIRAAALDAGCVARAAEGEFLIRPAGRAWLLDAGINAPKYARIQFPVAVCGDAGVILPDLPTGKIDFFNPKDISIATCGARPGVCPLFGEDRPFKLVAKVCAWKSRDAGNCTRSDGGDPGWENTMQPGQFAGAGCILKACVEVAGDSSAP
ncbi:MAG: hypothetical protein NTV51_04025 [Verrucomicrobia bacterium]|nr:hypothetical protein [Verrucomicrobiota bacterium]